MRVGPARGCLAVLNRHQHRSHWERRLRPWTVGSQTVTMQAPRAASETPTLARPPAFRTADRQAGRVGRGARDRSHQGGGRVAPSATCPSLARARIRGRRDAAPRPGHRTAPAPAHTDRAVADVNRTSGSVGASHAACVIEPDIAGGTRSLRTRDGAGCSRAAGSHPRSRPDLVSQQRVGQVGSRRPACLERFRSGGAERGPDSTACSGTGAGAGSPMPSLEQRACLGHGGPSCKRLQRGRRVQGRTCQARLFSNDSNTSSTAPDLKF